MSQLQRYLPVVEIGYENNILGLIDLGSNQTFQGTETSYNFTTPAGVQLTLTLEQWVPTPSTIHPQNPWFMVAAFDHTDIYNKAYYAFNFVEINSVLPSAQWSSGSGLANVLVTFDGLILRGLSQFNGFSD